MKKKIKFYFARTFVYGMFVAMGIFNLVNAIEEKLGWLSITACAVWCAHFNI